MTTSRDSAEDPSSTIGSLPQVPAFEQPASTRGNPPCGALRSGSSPCAHNWATAFGDMSGAYVVDHIRTRPWEVSGIPSQAGSKVSWRTRCSVFICARLLLGGRASFELRSGLYRPAPAFRRQVAALDTAGGEAKVCGVDSRRRLRGHADARIYRLRGHACRGTKEREYSGDFFSTDVGGVGLPVVSISSREADTDARCRHLHRMAGHSRAWHSR